MSRHDQTLICIAAKPVPASIKWAKIKSLLLYLGYEQIKTGKTGGSRRKFYHKEKNDLIICHKPHPEPTVDKGCLSDIVQHLRENGFYKKVDT